jgi:hypothetical protein
VCPGSGRGSTIGDLAAKTGKSRATVSRHLKRLAAFDLVFSQKQQDGSTAGGVTGSTPTWSPNTTGSRTLPSQVRQTPGPTPALLAGHVLGQDDGRIVREHRWKDHYIDRVTGAVLWVDTSTPA